MPRPPSPLAVVLNATAGTGCPPEWVTQLRGQFAAHGIDAQVEQVAQGSQIIPTVQRFLGRGARTIVAGGGDGTISAVASQLAGTEAVLGVLPLGTLNHFAKDLGMPLAQEEAVAAIAAGTVEAVDVGEVNGRIFINNSSIGLYPEIVRERELQQLRLGKSKWRALASASLHATEGNPGIAVHIAAEDEEHLRRTPFVFIGNNRYVMEGFDIGARETLDAGELALYLGRRRGRLGLVLLALRALLRRLEQSEDFEVLAGESFEITTRGKRIRVATDGEVTMMDTPLHYRIRPRALRVLAPPAKA